MPSLGASSLAAAVSITNEIEIRIRDFAIFPYHQKVIRLNSGDYSSPIPNTPLKIRRKIRFFFKPEKIYPLGISGQNSK